MFWIGFFIIIKCEVKLEIEATYSRDNYQRVMIHRQYQIWVGKKVKIKQREANFLLPFLYD